MTGESAGAESEAAAPGGPPAADQPPRPTRRNPRRERASHARGRGNVRPGHVAVGRVIAAWGVNGAFKVTPLTDYDERFEPGSKLFLAGRRREVETLLWHRGNAVIKLAGIDDPDSANRYRGEYLEIPESEAMPLADGQYYRWQLEGLEAVRDDGTPLGTVREVMETGANDVLIIAGPEREYLVPLMEDIVAVDLAGGRVTVTPLPGLLD